jgi:putative mRNA 3-end processing factor
MGHLEPKLDALALKGKIANNGAVLLGKNFVCDSHMDRAVRVVTHCHADHVKGLRISLDRCERVLMTPATREMVAILRSRRTAFSEKVETLKYGVKFTYEDEGLSLFNAGHIIGSAQVLVEDAEGTRIVYTSDFKMPEAKVIECDLLIMEATYGNPSYTRPFKALVESAFVSLIERELKRGPVYIFGYHGKLQEAMEILRRGGINVPFILTKRVYLVAKVCEKYGMRFGDHFVVESEEAEEAMKAPYVGVYHMNQDYQVTGDVAKIYLSGWEFDEPCKKTSHRKYTVALSDHSDFDQLLEYVEECKPKLVITDKHRVGDAVALAKEIWKQLKIPAKPMP